jgi:hypothetical protein
MWGPIRVSESKLNSDGHVKVVGGSNPQDSGVRVLLVVCITVGDK